METYFKFACSKIHHLMSCKETLKCLIFISLFSFYEIAYSQQSDSTRDSTIRYYKTTLTPLNTSSPTITTKTIDTYSNFIIKMTVDSFIVKNKRRVLPITSTQQLDKYFETNISEIRTHTIIIEGSANLKYERFKEVIAVLKKYKLYHFELVTIKE